jgi:hypothetical protein
MTIEELNNYFITSYDSEFIREAEKMFKEHPRNEHGTLADWKGVVIGGGQKVDFDFYAFCSGYTPFDLYENNVEDMTVEDIMEVADTTEWELVMQEETCRQITDKQYPENYPKKYLMQWAGYADIILSEQLKLNSNLEEKQTIYLNFFDKLNELVNHYPKGSVQYKYLGEYRHNLEVRSANFTETLDVIETFNASVVEPIETSLTRAEFSRLFLILHQCGLLPNLKEKTLQSFLRIFVNEDGKAFTNPYRLVKDLESSTDANIIKWLSDNSIDLKSPN